MLNGFCITFRRIYNDLASTDSDLKQFQQHANALSQIQLAAAQAQLQQQQQQQQPQQPAVETAPSSQPMDTQQILQQTVSYIVLSNNPYMCLN